QRPDVLVPQVFKHPAKVGHRHPLGGTHVDSTKKGHAAIGRRRRRARGAHACFHSSFLVIVTPTRRGPCTYAFLLASFQRKRLAKGIDNVDERGRQAFSDRSSNHLGHVLVKRLSDATSNRGLRIGVTAQ